MNSGDGYAIEGWSDIGKEGVGFMTPQSISQRARELWEQSKAEDGWDDSMRMAYIIGACDGMADMQEGCHSFKSDGSPNLLDMINQLGRSQNGI